MPEIAHLRARVTQEGVVQAKNELLGYAKAANSVGASTKAMSTGLGAAKAMFIGLAAAATAFASINVISEFEKSMSGVRAATRATNEEMARLNKTARELGANSQFSASGAGEAMETLAKAGFKTTRIIEAMPTVLNLATAGSISLGTAADVVAKSMAAFSIAGADASKVADTFAAAAAESNTDVQQIAIGMRYAGPAAHAFGITIQDTAAALGTLSDAGLAGSMAGTGLRRVLSELADPSRKATKEIENMGLKVSDLNPQAHSLIEIVQQLKDHNLDAAQSFKIFGDRGSAAALALTEMLPELKNLTALMKDSDGRAKEMADIMSNNLWGAMKRLLSMAKELGLAFGEGFGPALTDTTKGLTEFLASFRDVARDLGTLFGGALSVVAGLLKILAENADAVKVAFTGIIAVKVANYALGVAAAIKEITIAATAARVGMLSIATEAVTLKGLGAYFTAALGPIGAVTAAVVALAAALSYMATQWSKESDAAMAAMTRTAEAGNRMRELMSKDAEDLRKEDLATAEKLRNEVAREIARLVNEQERQQQQKDKSPSVFVDPNLSKAMKETEANLAAAEAQWKLLDRQVETVRQRYNEFGAAAEAAGKKLGKQGEDTEDLTDAQKEYNRTLKQFTEEVEKSMAEELRAKQAAEIMAAARGKGREATEAAEKAVYMLNKQAELEVPLALRQNAAIAEMVRKRNEQASATYDVVHAQEEQAKIDKIVTDLGEKLLKQLKQEADDRDALKQAMVNQYSAYDKAIAGVQREIEEEKSYQEALKGGKAALMEWTAAKMAADFAAQNGLVSEEDIQRLKEYNLELLKERDKTGYVEAYKAANDGLVSDLQQGVSGAFRAGLVEFANGGKDALKHFGQNLLQVFIDAVAQYLTKMLSALATELAQRLSNVAIESGARQTAGATSAATGAATNAATSAGTSAATSGAMSGMGTFVAVVAVFAAAVAVFKHQTDRANAVRYDTVSGVKVTDGLAMDGFIGKLSETGPKVAAAIGGLLNAFQTSTGSFMEGVTTAEVQIRNDKTHFRAVVNGILVGEFATAGEAIIEAAKSAFLGSNLSRELDPIMRKLIQGFKGSDPQELIKAMQSVQGIIDEIGSVSEVEISLRDLPARANAMASELTKLGLTFDDATELANRWKLNQYQALRDQITGHEKTAKEEMAERQRQAAMFNAEIALLKAETQLKRDEIAARVAALKANGQIFEGQVGLDQANLAFNRDVLMGKADLYDREAEINQWYLETLGQTTNASLMMLEQQLAALDAMLANMPEFITPGEIRPRGGRGGHGGGGNTGPSEREQREASFNDFMESQMIAGLSDLEAQLYELNKAFEAQRQAAEELGRVEELEAARVAAIARLREDFLEGIRLEGLSDYQRALAELNAAFAEQALLNPDLVGGEEELAAARRAALNNLREDLLDSFGTPMEALSDRIADFQQRMRDLADANAELANQFKNGEISAQEYADAMAHSDQVLADFVGGLKSELLNLALYFTDAMGDTEMSANIRKQLAQLEWQYKKVEIRMMIEAIRAAGGFGAATLSVFDNMFDAIKSGTAAVITAMGTAVNGVISSFPAPVVDPGGAGGTGGGSDPNNPGTWSYQDWIDWLNSLPDLYPGGIDSGGGGGGGDNGNNEMEAAMERLRRALDALREFQEGLLLGSESPLTVQQRFEEAQRQYQQVLAAAQGGDVSAIEQLPQVAQQYLQLAAQMFGTAGAGYQGIFDAVYNAISQILLANGNIPATVPSGGGGNSNGGHPAGWVYYGQQWGWHPLGWSPGNWNPGNGNALQAQLSQDVLDYSQSGFWHNGSDDRKRKIESAPSLEKKLDETNAKLDAVADRLGELIEAQGNYAGRVERAVSANSRRLGPSGKIVVSKAPRSNRARFS